MAQFPFSSRVTVSNNVRNKVPEVCTGREFSADGGGEGMKLLETDLFHLPNGGLGLSVCLFDWLAEMDLRTPHV